MSSIIFTASDNSCTSGAFLCLVALCQLLEQNHQVYVILPYDGDGTPLLEEAGIDYKIIESRTWTYAADTSLYQKARMLPRFLKYNIPAIHQIRRVIREKKADIVHINTIWTYVGAVAALREHVSLVWHIRELLSQQQRQILFPKLAYKLLNKSDKILAVSNYITQNYPLLRSDKLALVYDGLDESVYYCDRTIFPGETIRLLHIGYMNEQKSQETILLACGRLLETGFHNFRLNLVGDGDPDYVSRLKALASRLGLGDFVRFCGPTRDTPSYYRNADIFIMSSRSEAFGRTTVEAMMSGCAVIGAASGATPELLDHGHYGYLYEYGNGADLCDTLLTVMAHKSDARLTAKNGQTFASRNFTAQNNRENVEKTYDNLTQNRKRIGF